ncbi:MAG TPA: cupin domain-containing protein [Acidimicrobiia bacterium]|nr:cupin domain-containing protein [Acidimicrobiia bacterium]
MKSRAIVVPDHDGEHLRLLGCDVTIKATVDDTAGAVEWVEIAADQGTALPPHRHPWGESYYVIEGTLEVQVGGRHNLATAGDFITIPPRAVHAFVITSERARFLHVSTGPGATAMFNEYAQTIPDAPNPADPEALARVLEVGARHGIEWLAPQPA